MSLIIGHRGARGEAPENTVDSFELAASNNCTAFELDIQITKDRKLIVFHDKTLGRCTGVRGRLSRFNTKQLSYLDARSPLLWHRFSPIPLLSDVIKSVPNTKDWQFEVKPTSKLNARDIAIKLSALLTSQQSPLGRVTVTSSSIIFLNELKKYGPNVRRGLVEERGFERGLKICKKMRLQLLALKDDYCSAEAVAAAQEQNTELSVWTVNSAERIEELTRFGVDSIITDYPSQAIRSRSSASRIVAN